MKIVLTAQTATLKSACGNTKFGKIHLVDGNELAASLRSESFDHGCTRLDALDAHATIRNRDGESASTNSEF